MIAGNAHLATLHNSEENLMVKRIMLIAAVLSALGCGGANNGSAISGSDRTVSSTQPVGANTGSPIPTLNSTVPSDQPIGANNGSMIPTLNTTMVSDQPIMVPAVPSPVAGAGADLSGNGITTSSYPKFSAYDKAVLSDKPIMFLAMQSAGAGTEIDLSANGHTGSYFPKTGSVSTRTVMPNGDIASVFDGVTQYLEIADSDSLSVPQTGVLTLEGWIRPATLQFKHQEGSGYVWWMGKGAVNQYEYAFRMYSYSNTETPPRPNRLSAYAFNLKGGLGSGSYFQDTVYVDQWLHLTAVINVINTSAAYPTGYVKFYKNGVLRDTTALNQFSVNPGNGTAPYRIGTRNFASFFQGAIGKVAAYNYELKPGRILFHYTVMCPSTC